MNHYVIKHRVTGALASSIREGVADGRRTRRYRLVAVHLFINKRAAGDLAKHLNLYDARPGETRPWRVHKAVVTVRLENE